MVIVRSFEWIESHKKFVLCKKKEQLDSQYERLIGEILEEITKDSGIKRSKWGYVWLAVSIVLFLALFISIIGIFNSLTIIILLTILAFIIVLIGLTICIYLTFLKNRVSRINKYMILNRSRFEDKLKMRGGNFKLSYLFGIIILYFRK